MKVISLLQPWATLVVIGAKKIETRSWNTKYRGELLIHASAKFDKEQERLALEFSLLLNDSRVYHCLLGAIIGKVNLMGTIKSDVCFLGNEFQHTVQQHYGKDILHKWVITEQELAFGNYDSGRYGWLLSDPVQFDEPIPAKGSLGLWEYKDAGVSQR